MKKLKNNFAVTDDILNCDVELNVWLDDMRTPPLWANVWCQDAEEAVKLLKTGRVTRMSFDHDLGKQRKTGGWLARWIEKKAFNNSVQPFKWNIHSANPVGYIAIMGAMLNADKFWGKNKGDYSGGLELF